MPDGYAQSIARIRRAGDIAWAEGWEAGNPYAISGSITVSTTHSRVSGQGYGMQFGTQDGNASYLFVTMPYNMQEALFVFGFKTSGWGAQRAPNIVGFLDDFTSPQLYIACSANAAGNLYVHRPPSGDRNNFGTHLGSTSGTPVFPVSTWVWVEAKVKIHSSTGYVNIRVNGVEQLNLTNVNTRGSTSNNYFNMISLGFTDLDGITNSWTYDDLICFANDGDGMAFPGELRVYDLVPSGDGTYTQWTSTGANHWSTIDEQGTISDADYVQTATAGNKDTFTLTDLPSNVQSVLGVVHSARAFKTDAGTRKLRFLQRQGGTDYERGPQTDIIVPGSAGEPVTVVDMINPATGLNWTTTDLNTNAEFGFKLQE